MMTVYNASSKKPYFLNAREMAPGAASKTMFLLHPESKKKGISICSIFTHQIYIHILQTKIAQNLYDFSPYAIKKTSKHDKSL